MPLTIHQQLYEAITRSRAPLIAFHKNAGPDAVVSSLALAELMRKIGKPSDIVAPNFEMPHNYKFLAETTSIKCQSPALRKIIISLDAPNAEHPALDYVVEENKLHIHIQPKTAGFSRDNIHISDNQYANDLIITICTPDLNSLDELFSNNTDMFFQSPIINIDHAPENEHYGQINLVNLTSSSVSEIIYDFIESIDAALIDEKIATFLLAGMIEKTRSFKIPTVTPKSLNIASRLMAAGAEQSAIIKNLYQRQTIGALKLWGRVLQNLKTDERQKIAWAEISETDFIATFSRPEDLAGVIDELIVSIPTIEFTALFFTKENQQQCLIKSEKNIDLRTLFVGYAPTGSKELIKFNLNAPAQNIIRKLQEIV